MKGTVPIETDTDALEVRQQLVTALTGLGFTVETAKSDTRRNLWMIDFITKASGVFTIELARTGS
jgi:hypothetical protein